MTAPLLRRVERRCLEEGCANRQLSILADLHLTGDNRIAGYQLSVCVIHYADMRKWILRGATNRWDGTQPDADVWLKRYCLMLAVLRDKQLFRLAMLDFIDETESRMAHDDLTDLAWAKPNRPANTAPIMATLRPYEGLCWFGTQPQLFAGLLSVNEFFDWIASGVMVKDPGPGPQHGEVSHPLQWHYLLRIMTNSFSQPQTAAWDCSPLELYTQMVGVGRSRNIWGTCLEGSSRTRNQGSLDSPGDPNWINRAFLPIGHTEAAVERLPVSGQRQAAGRAPWAGMFEDTSFGRALLRRFDKRQTVHEDIVEWAERNRDFLEIEGTHSYSNSSTRNRLLNENKAGVDFAATYLMNWTKSGGLPENLRQVIRQARHRRAIHTKGALMREYKVLEDAETFQREVLLRDRGNWIEKPNLDKRLAFFYWMEHFETRFDYGAPAKYQPTHLPDNGGRSSGHLVVGDGSLTDLPVAERLARSEHGLNPAYEFVEGRGAWRRVDDANEPGDAEFGPIADDDVRVIDLVDRDDFAHLM